MSVLRTQFLRPSRLVLLSSGLWAVDEFHPVAAVLDPDAGAVLRVVSWPEVPAGPPPTAGVMPPLGGDGTSLCVQHDLGAALHRIGLDGRQLSVWTGGKSLAACGPGVAWCRNTRRPQVEADLAWGRSDWLQRVDADGVTTLVRTQGLVQRVQAGPDGLQVLLAVQPTEGPEGTHPSGWVHLPWDTEVPDELTVAEHAVTEDVEPTIDPFLHRHISWLRSPPRTPPVITTDRHGWRVGWVPEDARRGRTRRLLRATAHASGGEEVRRWHLGRGEVLGTVSLGDRLAVTVDRSGGGSEVLALNPASDQVTVLLGPDAVDTTDLGWALVPRPVEADSYAAQFRADMDHLDSYGTGSTGLSDSRAALVGDWPDTQLEWTFRWTGRPGLILRRQVPLFDELGRIAEPPFATDSLMEMVMTAAAPPAEDAINGVLDL